MQVYWLLHNPSVRTGKYHVLWTNKYSWTWKFHNSHHAETGRCIYSLQQTSLSFLVFHDYNVTDIVREDQTYTCRHSLSLHWMQIFLWLYIMFIIFEGFYIYYIDKLMNGVFCNFLQFINDLLSDIGVHVLHSSPSFYFAFLMSPCIHNSSKNLGIIWIKWCKQSLKFICQKKKSCSTVQTESENKFIQSRKIIERIMFCLRF